ncbi:hypothetical protein Nepgr_026111 [Nepenthes gracilis]|uniref:NAC domain-containing protein n=1 Tax=Nepenthes gracilis TaxID=150966 RepID=A0AAD3Y0A5_NEPGR|nr:hypothetical protein Nepgr_026111 [Nepenthes gracilis]
MDPFHHHYSGGDANLPPGFRFHPTDEELITCYLLKKSSTAASMAELLLKLTSTSVSHGSSLSKRRRGRNVGKRVPVGRTKS